MHRARRDAEVDRLLAELEESRPYLGLAREIHLEVLRLSEDPEAGAESLADAMDRLPREARHRAAQEAFRALPADRRWEVLERLFGDDELRAALEQERAARIAAARSAARLHTLVERLRERGALDTRDLPADERLALGLYREPDVGASVPRGQASTSAARRLVLRATDEPGVLQVIEDVFNPAGGLFVTPDYDEQTFRRERLDPHALVRIGSANGERFEPVLYPGGRLDVETAGAVRRGRLHVGFAVVGDRDLFASHPTNRK